MRVFKETLIFCFYQHRIEVYMIGASLLVYLLYFSIVPIVDTPDSLTYLENANFFARVSTDYRYYYRPPGYPFLIFLSGYPYTHSVRILLVIQGLMAIAIPVLVYRLLLDYGKKTAIIGGYLIIATLSNCYFSTAIMSEQLYMFCLVLVIYLVSRMCNGSKLRYLVLACMACVFTLMVRGLVLPLVLLPLVIVLFKEPKKCGSAFVITGVCLLCIYGWIVTKNLYNADIPANEKFTNISLTNLGGKTLFSSVYLFSSIFNRSFILEDGTVGVPKPKVLLANGTYSRDLFRILKKDYIEYSQFYQCYATADDMARDYEMNPSIRKWIDLSFLVLDRQIGVVAADKLLSRVSYEAIARHPEVALTWLTNGILYLAGPPYMTQNDVQPVFYIPRLYIYYQSTESTKDQHYLKKVAPEFINRFAQWYGIIFLILKPAVFVLILIMAPFLMTRKNRLLTVVMGSIVLYHVLVTSIFTAPAERYVFTTFPFVLILLAVAIGGWIENAKNWRNSSHP